LDNNDIDTLFAAVRQQTSDQRFDLNGDGDISDLDLDYLIESQLNTRRGDLNLDGKVNFADFLILSDNFGKDRQRWATGDLNGDGSTGMEDFLLLSQQFGFNRDDQ
jgi:hypothetical protein